MTLKDRQRIARQDWILEHVLVVILMLSAAAVIVIICLIIATHHQRGRLQLAMQVTGYDGAGRGARQAGKPRAVHSTTIFPGGSAETGWPHTAVVFLAPTVTVHGLRCGVVLRATISAEKLDTSVQVAARQATG